MNSFCSFCSSAGIAGPHDHFLRASRAAGAAIICPKLKATRCNFCNMLGHTAKFCTGQKSQVTTAKKALAGQREANFQAGNWLTSKTTKKFGNITITDLPKLDSNVSRFSALQFDSDSDSDSDSDVDCADEISSSVPTKTWEQAIRGKPASPVGGKKHPILKSWTEIVKKPCPSPVQEEEEQEEELPPLIWGMKSAKRWADAA